MNRQTNEQRLKPYVDDLFTCMEAQYYADKTEGNRTVELICPMFVLDPQQPILDFGVKSTNLDYCGIEVEWYMSQSLSISGYVDYVKIWNDICSKDGLKMVNSNYGWCIFSSENGEQYKNCVEALLKDKTSRRAVMIYTRPSMHTDYCKNGMNDFMCTDGVQCFIRNNPHTGNEELIYVVKQRSCDFIYGFFNDFYWHCHIYRSMYDVLKVKYPELCVGPILYNAYSFHVYERHFALLAGMWEYIND